MTLYYSNQHIQIFRDSSRNLYTLVYQGKQVMPPNSLHNINKYLHAEFFNPPV